MALQLVCGGSVTGACVIAVAVMFSSGVAWGQMDSAAPWLGWQPPISGPCAVYCGHVIVSVALEEMAWAATQPVQH